MDLSYGQGSKWSNLILRNLTGGDVDAEVTSRLQYSALLVRGGLQGLPYLPNPWVRLVALDCGAIDPDDSALIVAASAGCEAGVCYASRLKHAPLSVHTILLRSALRFEDC